MKRPTKSGSLRTRAGWLAAALLAATALGCTTERLPTYPPLSFDQALPIIQQRTPTAFTLQGALTLSEPGRSITLDAALVVRQPSELRLRAWKFGQAVFDLTVRPDGTWAYSGRKEVNRTELGRMGESISTWIALLAPLPDDSTVVKETSRTWTVGRTIDQVRVSTTIDRPTLAIRTLVRFDAMNPSTRIDLSRHTLFGSLVWPQEIAIRRGDRQIRLRTSSLKPEVAERAFEPPRRAERITP